MKKILGWLCVAVSIVGIVANLIYFGVLSTLFDLPRLAQHLSMIISGYLCTSAEHSKKKQIIMGLLSGILSMAVFISTLIRLSYVDPSVILCLCYFPLAVVLYIAILKSDK